MLRAAALLDPAPALAALRPAEAGEQLQSDVQERCKAKIFSNPESGEVEPGKHSANPETDCTTCRGAFYSNDQNSEACKAENLKLPKVTGDLPLTRDEEKLGGRGETQREHHTR